MFAYLGFGISVLIAVLAYYIRPLRSYLAGLSIIGYCTSVGFLAVNLPYGFGAVFVFLGLYQLFNIARLIEHRLHAKHLKKAFFIGGARLLFLQIATGVIGGLMNKYSYIGHNMGLVLSISQLAIALGVLGLVIRRMLESKPKNIDMYLSDRELPTVSVLIPARNEDDNLVQALRAVVANDYPKLEILVLDDCSATARIPEIVKDFAHDGIRFVQGEPPKDTWLPKNQAYETLANASSGDWLLFMGVDVRLGTGSIRALVHYANNHKRSMISVLPTRHDGAFWSGFFSPLRYFREMLRFSFRKSRVPALSTAWLIDRSAYTKLGGVASVARKVVPEHYFANELSKLKQYAFVRTNEVLQVSTAKDLREQVRTSLRVIYPGSHGRIEWSALGSIYMFMYLFLPYVILVHSLVFGNLLVVCLSGLAVIALTSSHLMIMLATNPVLWPLAVVNFPYLVIQEIVLSFISMYRYEFGEVYWKERNICIPVLQPIAHLPPLDNTPS